MSLGQVEGGGWLACRKALLTYQHNKDECNVTSVTYARAADLLSSSLPSSALPSFCGATTDSISRVRGPPLSLERYKINALVSGNARLGRCLSYAEEQPCSLGVARLFRMQYKILMCKLLADLYFLV